VLKLPPEVLSYPSEWPPLICTYIRQVPVSFFDRDIGYPDFWFSLFASIPPSKCRCVMWIRLRRLPSKFLHNLLFINHPISQAL